MRIDPDKKDHVIKLQNAIDRAYTNLADFRRRRARFIRRFVGHNYRASSDKDNVLLRMKKPTVVNGLAQMVETYGYKYTANNPRVTAETEFEAYKPFALRYRLSVNRLLGEIDYKAEFRQVVLAALTGYVGIAKIHNGRSYELDFGDEGRVNPGKPCMYNISFDDWFHDADARNLRELGFCGNFYTKGISEILEDANISPEAKSRAQEVIEQDADKDQSPPVSELSAGEGMADARLEERVRLVDVWMPRERLVITMLRGADPKEDKRRNDVVLRVHEWGGVEQGPYRLLSFQQVPDNLMPLSTLGQVEMLDELYNVLLNQVIDQARRQKTLNVFTPAAEEDASRVQKAKDGDWVPVQNKDSLGQVSSGGPSPSNQALIMQLQQLFDRGAGNLPVAAGLSQQADTLGQEQMLSGAVSAMEALRQQVIADFSVGCIRDLGYLHFMDTFSEQVNSYSIGGVLSIPMGWTGDRKGIPSDYTLRIEPYSQQYTTPSQKLAILDRIMANYVSPLLPLLQQQGQTIDTVTMFDIIAEYTDQPWIRDIIRSAGGGPRDPNQFSSDAIKLGGGSKPNGVYTRRNVSARAPGQGEQMVEAMLAGSGTSQPTNGFMVQ